MTPAAHDTELAIDGDLYWVRRDFDLIRRIEQVFGPLGELDAKLRRTGLTAEELVRMLAIATKAQASRPDDDVLRKHVVEAGIREVSDQLAVLVLHLFAGHRKAAAWLALEAKRKAEGEAEGGDAEANPTIQAA